MGKSLVPAIILLFLACVALWAAYQTEQNVFASCQKYGVYITQERAIVCQLVTQPQAKAQQNTKL